MSYAQNDLITEEFLISELIQANTDLKAMISSGNIDRVFQLDHRIVELKRSLTSRGISLANYHLN